MRKWILLLRLASITVLLTGVAPLAAACGGPKRDELGPQPDFVGWVTAIEPGDGKEGGRIVVESQADKIVRRLIVTVTGNTQMYRREAGTTRQVNFADVALQDQAQLWLAGPVPRSFPAQVTARRGGVERLD
jgi:hypothetical protein